MSQKRDAKEWWRRAGLDPEPMAGRSWASKRVCSWSRPLGGLLREWLLVVGLLALAACTSKRPLADYPELTLAVALGDPPRSIAVLPFDNGTAAEGLEELVRTSVYSHLSVRPYRDVELQEVDGRLVGLRSEDDRPLRQIPVAELGRLLGCDAVVFGEVTEFRRVFVGIYSQISVGASIEIWDTRSGRMIWSDQHVVRYHEGGVPLDPLSVPLISIRSGLNLRGVVKIRAVDELGRYLARRIPAPKSVPDDGQGVPHYTYELQLGAFLGEGRAAHLLETLRRKGYPAFIRLKRDDQGLWHLVLLGPYEDQDEAIRVQEEIQQDVGTEPIIARILSRENPHQEPQE